MAKRSVNLRCLHSSGHSSLLIPHSGSLTASDPIVWLSFSAGGHSHAISLYHVCSYGVQKFYKLNFRSNLTNFRFTLRITVYLFYNKNINFFFKLEKNIINQSPKKRLYF